MMETDARTIYAQWKKSKMLKAELTWHEGFIFPSSSGRNSRKCISMAVCRQAISIWRAVPLIFFLFTNKEQKPPRYKHTKRRKRPKPSTNCAMSLRKKNTAWKQLAFLAERYSMHSCHATREVPTYYGSKPPGKSFRLLTIICKSRELHGCWANGSLLWNDYEFLLYSQTSALLKKL